MFKPDERMQQFILAMKALQPKRCGYGHGLALQPNNIILTTNSFLVCIPWPFRMHNGHWLARLARLERMKDSLKFLTGYAIKNMMPTGQPGHPEQMQYFPVGDAKGSEPTAGDAEK